MRKLLFVLISCLSFAVTNAQSDSVERAFAFRVSDFMAASADTLKYAEVYLTKDFPVRIKPNQKAVVFHCYKDGTKFDTSIIGSGRYYFNRGPEHYMFLINLLPGQKLTAMD